MCGQVLAYDENPGRADAGARQVGQQSGDFRGEHLVDTFLVAPVERGLLIVAGRIFFQSKPARSAMS